jgi:hypothetical protein
MLVLAKLVTGKFWNNLEASIKRKLENTITLYNYLKGLKRNKE